MVWFSQHVPEWLYTAVLLWFTHAEDFSDGMALREPERKAPKTEEEKNIYLSAEMQQNISQKVREELLQYYRFRANNVDKDFTDAEQAAAQEKLRQLSTLPVEL